MHVFTDLACFTQQHITLLTLPLTTFVPSPFFSPDCILAPLRDVSPCLGSLAMADPQAVITQAQ